MSSQIPDGMNIAEMINFIIKSMPAEDPLKYLGKELYTSTNPAFIQFGIEKAKEKAAQLNNKKGTKEVNIFFEFGQDRLLVHVYLVSFLEYYSLKITSVQRGQLLE